MQKYIDYVISDPVRAMVILLTVGFVLPTAFIDYTYISGLASGAAICFLVKIGKEIVELRDQNV